MSRTNHGAPKLPQNLLDQISNGDGKAAGRGGGSRKMLGRKEQRKAQREQKKQQRRPERIHFTRPAYMRIEEANRKEEPITTVSTPETSKAQTKDEKIKAPKSILKKAKRASSSEPEPEIIAPLPRHVKTKLDEDDAEIAALEKKLGLKGKKKLPKVFEDDGLGDLLEDLDDFVDNPSKRKRSDYEEYLASKRRLVDGAEDASADEFDNGESEGSGGSESDLDMQGDESEEDVDWDEDEDEDEDEELDGLEDEKMDFKDTKGNFSGFGDEEYDSDESETFEKSEQPKRVRENPYLPGVSVQSATPAKYVPPSMRGEPTSDSEAMSRLRRQLQGLLNKLSEANLITIVKDVEAIYNSNARQHVTTILVDLLMGSLCDRTSLMDTFIILHAGFATAIYRVIGAHFGAQLLERLVTNFDQFYAAERLAPSGTKETTNLMALLAELYTFQLVGSSLVFDYLRLFLEELTDLNTEILLKIIRNCGSQLRQDDPSSLKDIVIMLQKSVAKVGEANLSVRTKFMIETIDNLKNNRQKTGLAASTMMAEHTTKMKKTLGVLNAKAKASEPLGVSLADIKGGSKEGKWWLVGASWKNDVQKRTTTASPHEMHKTVEEHSTLHLENDGDDLLQLAREQRMNTDIRRAIFMNIMSASDYKDAHMRLTKLRLKKAQELEIPRVLIHCAGAEQIYNPFYTLIAKRLCSEHRFKWAMQYGLWDLFKRMGERNDMGEDSDAEMDDEEGDEAIDLRKIVNLGRMYGVLVSEDAMSLTSLKVLNFAYLQPKTKSFLEILLLTTFVQLSKRAKEADSDADAAIAALLTRAKDTPQVISGLQYFLAKQMDPAEITTSALERKILKKSLRVAKTVLTHLAVSSSTSDTFA